VKAGVWIHGDSLSPTDPALFVFDRAFLQAVPVSFPRLAFMYQGVRDVAAARAVDLVVGDTPGELAAFARRHGLQELHVTRNFTPNWEQTLDAFSALCPEVAVLVYEPELLTRYPGRVRRFFGFWKKVEREVLLGNALFGERPGPVRRPGERFR